MLKKYSLFSALALFASMTCSKAIIDADVKSLVNTQQSQSLLSAQPSSIPTVIFLRSGKDSDSFIAELKQYGVFAKKFESIPAVFVSMPGDLPILENIASHPAAMQISSFRGTQEELEFSEQAILLRPSNYYPQVNNWWDHGFKGQNSTVGILDSGIASEHPSLTQQLMIIRKESDSGYDKFKNGVRTAHGTGMACIYAGSGSSIYPNDSGIAPEVHAIVSGLTSDDDDIVHKTRTLSSMDWMITRAGMKPDVINYSNGNGSSNCSDCNDWSGFARIVDYVVNHHHILWVKSAGNSGYTAATGSKPFAATITVPADNYNAITVANMNPVILENDVLLLNPNRAKHSIRYTSSRGPTLIGRKKPDISAPGNDTRTCAPDPTVYPIKYTKAMDYHDGYRLVGGTSSATPHVGAAALLLHDAGISSAMAKKALLINSADAYTDSNKPGPDDPGFVYEGGHYPVMGSEWNRTYGWGYLNMQTAFDQRNNLIQDTLTLKNPIKFYRVDLPVGAKITLVHERRVGYSKSGEEWKLSHLQLEIMDAATGRIIMQDNSAIDTVHQVANCLRKPYEPVCSEKTKPLHALIIVRLMTKKMDGTAAEPFALVSSKSFRKR